MNKQVVLLSILGIASMMPSFALSLNSPSNSNNTVAEGEVTKEDSAKLNEYYLRCLSHDDKSYKMLDTLYSMAVKAHSAKLQVVANQEKANHWYFWEKSRQHMEESRRDSFEYWMNRTQVLAEKTNQPVYYYFAWQRYIEFLIVRYEFNTAMLQTEQLQKKALKENYMPAVVIGYKIMARICYETCDYKHAIDNQLKAISFAINTKDDAAKGKNSGSGDANYNLCMHYTALATYLMEDGQLERSYQALQQAKKLVKSKNQYYKVLLQECEYWYLKKNLRMYKKVFDEISKSGFFKYDIGNRYERLYKYHVMMGNYEQAVAEVDSCISNVNELNPRYTRDKADFLSHIPGKEKEAFDEYRRYVNQIDSINNTRTSASIAELATLYNVSILKAEKAQLEVENSHFTAIFMTVGFGLALLLLGLALWTIYIKQKSNHMLSQRAYELKRKNDELLDMRQQLIKENDIVVKSLKIKQSFMENMSHEIRTPLNAILGYVQVAASEMQENEEMAVYSSLIETNTDKLLKLVDDVIQLSNYDSSDVSTNLQQVNVNEICRNEVRKVEGLLQSGVMLDVKFCQEPMMIETSEKELSCIISNLLHNAVKFTEHGCVMLETCIDSRQRLEIRVTDTGIGIPADQHEWVFGRFNKIDSFKQGFGLGLSLAQEAANLLGAEIKIDEEYTNGTRFIVYLSMLRHSEINKEEA